MKLKRDLKLREKETASARARRIVVAVHKILREWPSETEGDIGQTIAVLAWRKKIDFNPGATNAGDVRALVRWLTGYKAKKAFALAKAVQALNVDPDKAAKKLAKAGGVDRLAFGSGKARRRRRGAGARS